LRLSIPDSSAVERAAVNR